MVTTSVDPTQVRVLWGTDVSAVALLATMELPLTADQSVSSAQTVLPTLPVLSTIVKIPVWEDAEWVLCVRSSDMFQFAPVHLPMTEIHSHFALEYQQLLLLLPQYPLTLANHFHVDPIQDAKLYQTRPCVPVNLATEDLHQVADLNVLSMMNAADSLLAPSRNVSILVMVPVD